jgi:LPXTG-motif cell wall-anchored protein
MAILLLHASAAWSQSGSETGNDASTWLLIGGIAAAVVLLLVVWAVVSSNKKKTPPPSAPAVRRPAATNGGTGSGEPGIVVRRKTATILKKQSLEDVMDNPHFMKVDLEWAGRIMFRPN